VRRGGSCVSGWQHHNSVCGFHDKENADKHLFAYSEHEFQRFTVHSDRYSTASRCHSRTPFFRSWPFGDVHLQIYERNGFRPDRQFRLDISSHCLRSFFCHRITTKETEDSKLSQKDRRFDLDLFYLGYVADVVCNAPS